MGLKSNFRRQKSRLASNLFQESRFFLKNCYIDVIYTHSNIDNSIKIKQTVEMESCVNCLVVLTVPKTENVNNLLLHLYTLTVHCSDLGAYYLQTRNVHGTQMPPLLPNLY